MKRVWAFLSRHGQVLPYIGAGGGTAVALWSFIVTGDTGKGLWALQAAVWAVVVILQDTTIRASSPEHARLGRIITETDARVIVVDFPDRGTTHTFHRSVERTNTIEENNHGS